MPVYDVVLYNLLCIYCRAKSPFTLSVLAIPRHVRLSAKHSSDSDTMSVCDTSSVSKLFSCSTPDNPQIYKSIVHTCLIT